MSRFNPLDHPICFSRPLRLVEHSAWIEHTPFAMFLIDILRPTVFVELGTHMGVSYSAFCQAILQLGATTRAYAVDTWEGDAHSGLYGAEILSELRAYHDPLYNGFSRLIQSTFDQAVNQFPDHSIDLLHIDGLHSYEAVKHDFESWLPKLSEQAVVLFHDTNVREREFGVWKLWAEVKQKYPHFEFIHGHGLGILCVGTQAAGLLNDFISLPDNQEKAVREFFFVLGSRLSAVVETGQLVQTLNLQLDEHKQAIQAVSRDLQARSAELRALSVQVENIYQSSSWKITAPLRWAGGISGRASARMRGSATGK